MASQEGGRLFGKCEFNADERETIRALLEQKLGKEHLSERAGAAGAKFTYVESWKAIQLANQIFGFNGWSSSVVDITPDFVEEDNGRWKAGITAVVKVLLKDGTYHEDVGYGSSENPKKGTAIENAKKEAVTDARKRALRMFGNALGNCIYDKQHVKKFKTQHSDSNGFILEKQKGPLIPQIQLAAAAGSTSAPALPAPPTSASAPPALTQSAAAPRAPPPNMSVSTPNLPTQHHAKPMAPPHMNGSSPPGHSPPSQTPHKPVVLAVSNCRFTKNNNYDDLSCNNSSQQYFNAHSVSGVVSRPPTPLNRPNNAQVPPPPPAGVTPFNMAEEIGNIDPALLAEMR